MNYDIAYSGLKVPAGEKNVLIAVWSEANGQDDIVWYEASGTDGSYGVSVDIRDHGDMSGVYNAHAYATLKNGELVFIGKTAFEIEGSADGQITVSDTDAGNGIFTVSVQLSNIKGSVGNVRVPVWTRADQSDIYWYNAVNSGNGLYTATVDIRNHDNNTGLFYIHAYAVFSNRAEVFLTGVEHSFSTEAGLMVSNPDGSGTRRITYTNPSVSSVRFAVWTEENGQDDIRWYNANPAGNGAFYYDVSSADHTGNGKYIVHVYSGDTMLGNTSFGIVDYAEWAVRMSLDDSIGYSQDYRCLNPDVDCSSFIYYALYYNGFSGSLTSYPFYTGSQITYMERCGFEVMDFTSEADLKAGDVLWYRNGSMGHTEIYLGNGLMVGAHDSVVNGIDYSEGGDQTGQEVSVKAFSDPGWTKVLRIYG